MGEVVPLESSQPRFVRPRDLTFQCSDEVLLEAVQLWLLGAEGNEIAAMLQIPPKSLPHWVERRGWRELATLMRDAIAAATHGRITRNVNTALSQLEDRLAKGDQVILDGQVTYVPVKSKDLALIVGTLVDRQHEIEKRGSKVKDDESGKIELGELLEGLKRFAQAKEIQG